MNPLHSIAADVKLGKNVRLANFLNLYGCEIGDETRIGAFVEIQKNARVGNRCKISSHSFICEGVEIEDNVFIGHGVTFINDRYPRATNAEGAPQTEADWKVERTVVKKGASVGSGATVLAGLTIGENAIVGAGSVVTRDVPARTIVAGNPARIFRTLDSPGKAENPEANSTLHLVSAHPEAEQDSAGAQGLLAAGPTNPQPGSPERSGQGASEIRTVAVIGKGDLAIQVADWFRRSKSYKLVAIVPVIPEPTWTGSFKAWGRANQIPVVASGDYADLTQSVMAGAGIDLVVSVFYDKIVKKDFIARCGRIINIHNSPLPRYRGVAPINWALKNEEIEHGVSIHEITPGVDEGPILAQLKYSIYPEFDEVIDVYQRSLKYAWLLFEQTIPLLDKIEPRPQDDAAAIYFSNADRARLGERSDFTREASTARAAQTVTHQDGPDREDIAAAGHGER